MSDNQFKTNESIASYGIGLQMGQQPITLMLHYIYYGVISQTCHNQSCFCAWFASLEAFVNDDNIHR